MDSRGRVMAGVATLVVCLTVGAVARADAATYPSNFTEKTVAANLYLPTMAAWAPDGGLFVIQKSGQLLFVPPGGDADAPRLLLDIGNEVNEGGDRGLLGLAVDGQYAAGQRYVYLLYAAERHPEDPDNPGKRAVARLERVRVSTSNTVTSRTTILGTGPSGSSDTCPTAANTSDCIPSERDSHSIGTVRSAPDGTLYVGSGDGSDYGGADPQALGTQDEQSMRGKIVHIDRTGKGLSGHAFCPTDTDLTHVCAKLHAKGFRNPFRFQLLQDGRLAVGDVGWDTTEELDLISSGGGNYGWPCYEGPDRAPGYEDMATCKSLYRQEGTGAAATPPAYAYGHDAPRPGDTTTGQSIVVGPLYDGTGYPAQYRGRLFFADYVGDGTTDASGTGLGYIKSLGPSGSGVLAPPSPFSPDLTAIVALEKSPSGDLAYVSLGQFTPDSGSVRQIRYGTPNAKPVARAAAATPNPARPGQPVSFDASASTDPDGDPLSFAWDFGDGSGGSGAKPTHSYARSGCYTAQVTATDGHAGSSAAPVKVRVSADAPTPAIDGPSTYRDGEPVTLTGSGADPDRMSWNVTLHHETHIHDVNSSSGSATHTFTPKTDHDFDSYYEVRLTVTDECGATTTIHEELHPRTRHLTISSQPAGARISWGSGYSTVGFDYDAVVGFDSTVSAPESFVRDGTTYTFAGWSDGGAASHDVTMPDAPLDLVASYTASAVLTPPEPGAAPSTPLRAPAPQTPSSTAPETKRRTRAPSDRTPPKVGGLARTLDAQATTTLRGRATDAVGVRSVHVFLARRLGDGSRCRFWSPRREALGPPRPCDRPMWIPARLTGRRTAARWSVRPWERPVPGRWLGRVRARDAAGNAGSLTFTLFVSRP